MAHVLASVHGLFCTYEKKASVDPYSYEDANEFGWK